MVILEWLVQWFAPARSYTENEVNAILSDHLGALAGQEHAAPDVATVRRELIWNGFMVRERSIYRRSDEPHDNGIPGGSKNAETGPASAQGRSS
jgi:hypothetical protein